VSEGGPPPVVLTIAGSDSGGGAGVQADLKTWQSLGVFGTSALTCVTAQNTREVRRLEALDPSLVADQIAAVFEDFAVVAVKTGALPTPEIVCAVAEALRARGRPTLVVDPVLVATSGDALGVSGVSEAMLSELGPIATLFTPNLEEAQTLAGAPVRDLAEMRAAAHTLCERGLAAVLIKGGHLRDRAVDLLAEGQETTEFEAPRLEIGPVHGTGCSLSAAIVAGLARGRTLAEAVEQAKSWLHAALRGAWQAGQGARVLDWRRSEA
jgi:hydroxymethylpyrimidine/phosphomethylpyrimidine kinase